MLLIISVALLSAEFLLASPTTTVKDHVMAVPPFSSLYVTDWLQCIMACQENKRCSSYNYENYENKAPDPTHSGRHLCELNECGMEGTAYTEELIYKKGFVFQQLIQPSRMVSQDCKQKRQAILIKQGVDIKCFYGTRQCSPYANCVTSRNEQCSLDGACVTSPNYSVSCRCKDGFTGDGLQCNDDNECDHAGNGCPIYTKCINTMGSFKCVCNDGYYDNEGVCAKCKAGWHLNKPTQACFKLFQDHLYWSEAQDHCQTYGANLTSIHTASENAVITQILRTQSISHAWIGFNDLANESSFIWKDGTFVDYYNWGSNKPSDVALGGADKDCVYIMDDMITKNSWKWFDAICEEKKAFVCRLPAGRPL